MNNISAFLDMLAASEGTAGHGDDGYNVIVGGDLFHGYAKHPNVLVTLNSKGLKSTAAGRYQFLYRTWVALQAKLGLATFSPRNQDLAAVELIRERHALDDVEAGRLDAAVAKCAPIWASLPGAGYGQLENELAALRRAYTNAGGTLA
jgi:muramidase (phage lysozyme)